MSPFVSGVIVDTREVPTTTHQKEDEPPIDLRLRRTLMLWTTTQLVHVPSRSHTMQ